MAGTDGPGRLRPAAGGSGGASAPGKAGPAGAGRAEPAAGGRPGAGQEGARRKAGRRPGVRRRHKDGLFCRLFSDRENALSLYNALTGSSCADADGLEIVTLEDAVYLSQKNDCAVCVQSALALFEQQSSWNPNMPLRGLLYFAAEYAGWLARHRKDVHSGGLVKIPSPCYYVLYNGTDRNVERAELRLSDAFERPAEGYEWTAHVVNVNAGHNEGILTRCEILGEYARFIGEIRRNRGSGLPLEEAVDAAVAACIGRGGRLAEFMRKHKGEVDAMYLFGVDFEKIHREALREEAWNDGMTQGLAQGMSQGQERDLRSLMCNLSWTAEQAMDALGIPEGERGMYLERLSREA